MTSEPSVSTAPIGARLRAETRDLHAEVERTLSFLTPEVRRTDYRSFLECWHGFHRVLEPRLDAWHRREELLDWPPRRKLGLLEADLRTLGADSGELGGLPACPGVPQVDGTAAALGVLYVVEGATLGGAVLRRRLTSGCVPHAAVRFLSSNGDDIGGRWRTLQAATASWVGDHPGQADRLVATARGTFEVLVRWAGAGRVST